MPRINLGNVSDGELQRLFEAARSRRDAPLRETIEQEIAMRADGPRRGATASGPRMVLVELDDLLAASDPGPASLPASPVIAAEAPLAGWAGRRMGPGALAFGVAAGMLVGWWAAGLTRQPPRAAPVTLAVQPAAQVAAPIRSDPPAPAPMMVADVTPPAGEPPPKPPAPKASPGRRPAVVAVKLRRAPAAGRAPRAKTGDPQRLARLYDEGVRKLHVATSP